MASSSSNTSHQRSSVSDADSPLDLPPSKKRKSYKLVFKPEWKCQYLMWPAGGQRDGVFDEMIYILCLDKMKAKATTASRHLDRKHPSSKSFSKDKIARLLKQFEHGRSKQQDLMRQATYGAK